MHKGQKWTDLLAWEKGEVVIDEEGFGVFKCPGLCLAIWVNQDAEGRARFPVDFDRNMYKDL
jgi:alpha-amylase